MSRKGRSLGTAPVGKLVMIRPGVFVKVGQTVLCEDGSRWRLDSFEKGFAAWAGVNVPRGSHFPAQLKKRKGTNTDRGRRWDKGGFAT